MILFASTCTHRLTAAQVTVDNLDALARWCNGSVRGIKLPLEDQEIRLYAPDDIEQHAHVNDWIVRMAPKIFLVFSDKTFKSIFHSY